MNPGELLLSDRLSVLFNEAAAGRPKRATAATCLASTTSKAEILHLLGLQSLAGGDAMRAVVLLDKAARYDATNLAVLNNLGVALLATGDAQSAAACLRRAMQLSTDQAEAYGNLGIALSSLGDRDAAVECLSAAIERGGAAAPRAFRRCLAEVRIEQNRFDDAEASLRLMTSEDPLDFASMLLLGKALSSRREWEAATACFDRILAVHPAHLGALCGLAQVIDDDRVEALAEALQIAERSAADPEAQYQVEWALATLAHLRRDVAGEALHCRRALEHRPGAVEVEVALAKLSLLRGDFAAGWSAFEWRWRQKPTVLRPRGIARPRWRGEALHGDGILLHAEQGLGCNIHLARYAPLVAARGGRVVLEVPGPLVRLMRSLAGGLRIVARGEPVAPVEWQCPFMSLPRAFRTDMDSIPAPVSYLAAEPYEARVWSKRLPKRFRVGIVWAGAPGHYNNRRRSMPALALAPLKVFAEIAFVSLQVDPDGRAGTLPFAHVDAAPDLSDFAVTAAVIANLDLVIAVDTAVAHLAGALGKPVWILLPFAGEYRWLLEREDSPWYPTARLFRQPVPGDWTSVVARVARQLRALVAEAAT